MPTTRQPAGHIVTDLRVLVRRGVRFSTIYADPPWAYDNRAARGAAERHYRTMSVADIAALPVPELAAASCHLHLWTTAAFLFEARTVLDAWGFKYKGIYAWCKPVLGCGNYWRNGCEFMLLGVKGDLPFQDRSVPNWLIADRGDHSAKPEAVRRLIERVSPPPYLELFGRKVVPHGWAVFGDQVARTLFDDDIPTLDLTSPGD